MSYEPRKNGSENLSPNLSPTPVPNDLSRTGGDRSGQLPLFPVNTGNSPVPATVPNNPSVYLSPCPPLYIRDRDGTGTPDRPEKSFSNWSLDSIEVGNPAVFGRYATTQTCHRCGAWVLAGWDSWDDYAGAAVVDPYQLTSRQELDAVLARRDTYRIITDARTNRHTLERRTRWTIRPHPASGHPDPIAPVHRCNDPTGTPIPFLILYPNQTR